MANNRIFLKNKLTGSRICIAKHFGSGWYTPGITEEADKNLGESISKWFEDQEESFWKNEWFVELEYEESEEWTREFNERFRKEHPECFQNDKNRSSKISGAFTFLVDELKQEISEESPTSSCSQADSQPNPPASSPQDS